MTEISRRPTITISIVCSPEQLAHLQARVSALQANLYRLAIAFSVSTHRDPPPWRFETRPMTHR